jgi:hypothetical protein
MAIGIVARADGGSSLVMSAFSPIGGKRCTVSIDRSLPDQSIQRCLGIAGYRLLVLDADSRMSVTIVARDGRAYPLNFADVVTHRFSRLGERAEWRLARVAGRAVPFAIIVPVLINESDDPPREASSLVVARIGAGSACVIGQVPARPAGAEAARALADRSAALPCMAAADD